MKLRSPDKAELTHDSRLAMALAALRHTGIMASQLRGLVGSPDALVAFERDQDQLRQRLQPFERRSPDLVVDFGKGLQLDCEHISCRQSGSSRG